MLPGGLLASVQAMEQAMRDPGTDRATADSALHLVQRARIVLLAAAGEPKQRIAARLEAHRK
jgi:hypothetical protein